MASNILEDLAEYIGVLSTSMRNTRRAEDRSEYTGHLAAAALIFQLLQQSSLTEATQQVSAERQAYGRSFLDGEEGKFAEAAFIRFAALFAQQLESPPSGVLS